MVFLIDFENVSNGGFNGLEDLSEEDRLIIFYSEKLSKISMSTHHKLEMAEVKKEYFPVKAGGKNALDFQLSTYLGYLIANNKNEEYCIVSNDTGYQFVIDFWKEKKAKIIRCADLRRETKHDLRLEVEKQLPDYKDEAEKIVDIINKYKTKQGINNALMKEFGSEKTGMIYKGLRLVLKNKK